MTAKRKAVLALGPGKAVGAGRSLAKAAACKAVVPVQGSPSKAPKSLGCKAVAGTGSPLKVHTTVAWKSMVARKGSPSKAGKVALSRASSSKTAGTSRASPSKAAATGGASPSKAARSPSKPEKPPATAAAVDAHAVAREVLRLGELGDYEAVLGVLGDRIEDAASPAGKLAARKAFLRISLLIHPDKLSGFAEATRAFQFLVTAFDRVQRADVATVSAEAPKFATLGRSNEGCFRTKVLCPRCKVPWGSPVEGNPDYYYNFMMEGLRTFTCSTCLLSFGCLTAIHLCPWCNKAFEYAPEQYHSQVTCGNPGCKKQFGFLVFHASENALRTGREQAREELTRRSRTEDAKRDRARRAARRAGGDVGLGTRVLEAAFAMGLRDTCPRCGLVLEEFEDGEQLRHLRACTDTAAQRAHREREAARAKSAKAAERKERQQLSAASGAVWSSIGGRASQLWMLDAEQLRRRCKQLGLLVTGGRDKLIQRLAEKLPVEDAGMLAQSLPKNLHALTDEQLAAVCASFRLRDLRSRDERLEALEELQLTGAVPQRPARAAPQPALEAGLALEAGTCAKKARATAAKAKPKAKVKAKTAAGKPHATGKLAAAVAKLKATAKMKAKSSDKGQAKAVVKSKAKPSDAKGKAKAKALSKRR